MTALPGCVGRAGGAGGVWRRVLHVLGLLLSAWALSGNAASEPLVLTEMEQQWLAANADVIRVGVIEIPPLVMRDNTTDGLQGMAIQFMHLYEAKLGVRFKVVLLPDWKSLIDAARKREVDAVLTAVDTPERRTFLSFPPPYVTLKNVIIGRQGEVSGGIDLSRLAGKRVAMLEASAVHERMLKEFPDVRPLALRDERALLSSVGLHEADFAVTELSRAIWWIEHDKLATLTVVGETPFDYPLSLAVRSDRGELASALDKAGRSFRPEEAEAIHRQWVRLDAGARIEDDVARQRLLWGALLGLAALAILVALLFLMRRRILRQTIELRAQLDAAESMHSRLELSERKFRELAELTSDMFWETNDKLVFVRCHGGREAAGPIDEAALLGKAWWDLPLRGVSRQELDALAARMSGHEAFRRWVAQWPAADGSTRWISVSGHPFYDQRSNFLGYRGTWQDITVRKQQEILLTRTNQQLQAVQDGTLSFFGLLSPDGILVDCNRAAFEFIGVDKKDLIGLPFWDLPWWRVGEEALRLQGSIGLARAGQFVRYDAQTVDAAGVVHWIDFSLSPFFDEFGKLVYLVPEGRDITEAKRASTLLENLLSSTGSVYGDAFFRKLVESMGRLLAVRYVFVGRLLADRRRISTLAVWAGGAFADNFEYSLESTPCEKVMDQSSCCVHPRGVQEAFPDDDLLQKLGAESYMGVPIQGGTGQTAGILVVLNDRPLIETAGARRLMELFAVRAATELDRMTYEAEIRQLNSGLEERVAERTVALQQANRELEAFSYSVSHDLRAPLRHIAGFIEMLGEDAESTLSPEGQRFLRIIGDSARRMGRMIDDLLSLSRAGRAELRKSPVGLRQLVLEVIENVKLGLGERAVAWHIGELPEVSADRGLLTLVLNNLIENAVKYSRNRTPAEVSVEMADADGREWVIVVRDNGIGFDMKYAGKLFGVFQRLHSDTEYEGTGIGLANVRRIVERHGGRVWAEAEPDRGAAFFFSLPRDPALRDIRRTALAA